MIWMTPKKSYIVICPESYGLLPVSSFQKAVQNFENDVKSHVIGNKDTRLCDLSQSDILRLLSHTEKLDKSLRSCLKPETLSTINQNGNRNLWTDVHVYEYPEAILLMDFPPLVNISYRNGEYGLSKRAEIALFQWANTHDLPDFQGENDRFLYLYKRFSTTDIGNLCDNDNWEMRRITNAVSQAIGYSDNPRFSEFFYTTVPSEFDGAELMLIRHSGLPKFIDYLSSGTPIHPESSSFFAKKQVEKSSDDFTRDSFSLPVKNPNTQAAKGIPDVGPCGQQDLTGIDASKELPF